MTSEVGQSDDGPAQWRLTVRGAAVPGRLVIVDRKFNAVGDALENPKARWCFTLTGRIE
jgi:hypothetical protein